MNTYEIIVDNLEELAFLELKENVEIAHLLGVQEELPLPILVERVVSGVKSGEMESGVNLALITESIGILLGTDKNFPYREDYLKILEKIGLDKYNYYLNLAEINIQKKKYSYALAYLNFLKELYPDDIDLEFKRVNILEQFYNENFQDLTEEDRQEILRSITTSYEKLTIEHNYPLAYYRLGYINLSTENYIKSSLYFEKYLNYSEDEELKQEVREELEELSDYKNIETANTYIAYGENYKAIEALEKVSGQYPNPEEVEYLLGTSYYNIGEYERAIEYLTKSLEKIKDNPDIYTRLALANVQLNKLEEGERIYKKAIFNIKDDYTIYYNLGIIELNRGKREEAVENLKKAYQLSSKEEIYSLVEEIKNGAV